MVIHPESGASDETPNSPKPKRPEDSSKAVGMSLDDKLKEILDYCAESYYPLHEYPDQPIYTDQNKVTLDEAVAQIKQAIADEGYVQIVDNPHGVKHVHLADFSGGVLSELLTGQEFYDRFWSIYNEDRNPMIADATIIREQIDKIVKRAAGLSDD